MALPSSLGFINTNTNSWNRITVTAPTISPVPAPFSWRKMGKGIRSFSFHNLWSYSIFFTFYSGRRSYMDTFKGYAVSWLEWGADYLKDDPQDFFSRRKIIIPVNAHHNISRYKSVIFSNACIVAIILLPLFALSGVMAYYLLKQIDKDEKRKGTLA